MFNVKTIAAATVAALAVGFASAWVVQDWRYGAVISDKDKVTAEQEAERERARNVKYNKLQVERDDLARRVAQIDGDYAGKLRVLQDENSKLADCLRSGKCPGGVRVAATCPKSSGRLPGAVAATSATSVVDAGAARLTPNAEQDYLALRSAITEQRLQIEGLQAYIRELRHQNDRKAIPADAR